MASSASSRSRPLAKPRKESPYDRIKQAIADGVLLPGEPLVEIALAEWCEVSRTPIREALTRLEQDGLVARTDRGLVVRERSHEEILDIYDVRVVLEGTVTRAAAARRSAIDLIHIRRASDAFKHAPEGDGEALAATNRDFHRAVWAASHNEALFDLLDRLQFHVARDPHTTLTRKGRRREAVDEHGAIVAAIEEQNLAQAEALAWSHFRRARDLRLEILASDIGRLPA
jgi:DNA-binding GntR family transcriptional regulator